MREQLGLPSGIEDIPSHWDKIKLVAADALTQFRSTVKKEVRFLLQLCQCPETDSPVRKIKSSIIGEKNEHKDIYDLSQRLAGMADLELSIPLCARIAVLVSRRFSPVVSRADLIDLLACCLLLRRQQAHREFILQDC